MKTAMQQFQDFVYEQIEKYKDHPGVAINKISQQSHYMLDIEKVQIEESFFQGQDGRFIYATQYYQETFVDNPEAGI